jgi:hypothetical protein
MSKLTAEQIETAKKLLKELNKSNSEEKQIFIVEDSKHYYSNLENAVAQAAGTAQVYKLELGEKEPVLVELEKKEKATVTLKSEVPDKSWKFEELKTYAVEIGVTLDGSEKSKDQVLAKIEEFAKKTAALGAAQ